MSNSTYVHIEKLQTMNKKIKKEKSFDTVKVLGKIKEKIAQETDKMSFVQFKECLSKNQLKASLKT